MAKKGEFDYDVCLSFAGENRAYVAKVADFLRKMGLRVFYDEYEKVSLWGKDLYEHLHEVYGKRARYCAVFISKFYGAKLWTNHERKSAQERAFKQHAEYVLPARFDKTELPGLRDTVGYISLKDLRPKAFAELVVSKLGPRQRANYFPPIPDRLFDSMPLDGAKAEEVILTRAHEFFEALRRMRKEERRAVFAILLFGCPSELPENVHINLDLLRRITGISAKKLKHIVGGLSSLGFSSRLRKDCDNCASLVRQEFLELSWMSRSLEHGGDATELASTIASLATQDVCPDCSMKVLETLDFGQLSSATHEKGLHHSGN